MQPNEVAARETRILRMFREYQAVKTELGNQPLESDEADAPFFKEMDAIEEKMMALPCTCAADFAAKVIVDTVNGGIFSDWKLGALWKEARELVGMPFLGLVEDDLKQAKDRLKAFGEWTRTEPPSELLDDTRAPTDELLCYCRAEGLSLDWLFLGDVRGLVMAQHNRAKEAA